MIIKLHGTSGAGKSTAVRALMDLGKAVPLGDKPSKPEAYCVLMRDLDLPVYVLGSYENQCGGMDGITSVDEQISLIHKYAKLGNVLYEGLLLSTYYGKLGAAVKQYGTNHVWAFLDTPMEVCIERVKQRRLSKGNEMPFNEENTRSRQRAIDSLRRKREAAGDRVVTIHHDQLVGSQLWEIYHAG